ncbi:MAG: GNAT family N-acetyltransferase [Bacteroidales bacterium]|nr:GNAT family N-acetyltransferase [Bacteroidales bacterium]
MKQSKPDTMHKIDIVEVTDEKLLKKFVMLPFSIYRNDPFWVAPMIDDELKLLRPSDNPAFEFCDVRLWLAFDGGKCVGRVGTIINRLWQEKTGLKHGRLTRFDSIDDIDVAKRLLATAEDYLRGKGIEAIHGPLGFTNLDHQGVLVEGFEYLPSVGSEYSKEYYHRLLEECGYEKQQDWLEFRITFPESLPEKTFRVAEAISKRYGLRVNSFTSSKQLREKAPQIFSLFNEAFASLFGTFAFTERLKEFYIEKYMPILVPRYVKTVTDNKGEMAGFIIALPSLSRALKRANGRLLPLGWWYVMKALKHPEEIDLLLTGVRPELQKLGVASLLMNELWKTASEDGVRFVETTGMHEDNKVAIQMWKSFDHIQHKRKRCYIKWLGGGEESKN